MSEQDPSQKPESPITDVGERTPLHKKPQPLADLSGVPAELYKTARTERVKTEVEQFMVRFKRVHAKVWTIEGQVEARDDLTPEQQQALLDLSLGFLRLDPRSLSRKQKDREEETDPYTKLDNASIQHLLVNYIVDASFKEADPEFTRAVYESIFNQARIIRELTGGIAYNIGGYWEGMRNELGMVNVLIEAGYHVFLPDYSQDRLGTRQDDLEVWALDVLNAVDLMAVSPDGTIFLIDVKGGREGVRNDPFLRRFDDFRSVELNEGVTNPIVFGVLQKVRQIARGLGLPDGPIIKTMVYVRGGEPPHFERADWDIEAQSPDYQREFLLNMGRLTSEVEQDILDGLNRLRNMATTQGFRWSPTKLDNI